MEVYEISTFNNVQILWAVLTQFADLKDCQNIHRFIDFLALFKESKWRLAKISNG